MTRPLSNDLRCRVVTAVVDGGIALDRGFRTVLKGERRPPKRPEPPQPPQCDDPFVATWMKIVDAVGELAIAHDRKWVRRRRS